MPPPIVVTTCTTELFESSVLFDVKEERAMRNTTATMSSSIMSAMSAPGSGELTRGRLPLSRNILPIMAVLLVLAPHPKKKDWGKAAPRETGGGGEAKKKNKTHSRKATTATPPAHLPKPPRVDSHP